MDYGKRIDDQRSEQLDIYGNIELVKALNRAQSNILYYAQYCDKLIDEEKAIENVPLELMMTAADESVFIMKQYTLLEKRYTKLAKTIKETFK
ncbi:hypothetical protein CKN73_03795 [Carnobacterium divergens]|uniref:hypothetical protein n=1 Tax=Carnobacterium divergens TaxID=2748 RepID=UPI001072A40E|nr:hypothetical protein [Carnobacterium divergens]TFJ42676.1 hypothetical protein CKN77_03725 [Carnobacterium divergens]TFJ51216.1 hypothetical protein CKN73_03795 [Carnobacterium divergens]TFJ56213.1 hypothetical protein CKN83_03740 [Carnobacterium divergens]TFJ63750.1 hypothetical protein CKN89_03820 [Carnobacterium divergens]TFJ72909.1 hypothetical protein CKN91_03745 [Carnobacterium divergens]